MKYVLATCSAYVKKYYDNYLFFLSSHKFEQAPILPQIWYVQQYHLAQLLPSTIFSDQLTQILTMAHTEPQKLQ